MSIIEMAGTVAIPAGGFINEFSAMTVPAFWSAISYLTGTLSSCRRAVHQETPSGRVITDRMHPVNALLRRRMSGVSTPNKTVETWVHHASVWGNGYLWIQRDARLRPTALLNVNPEIVTPFTHDGQKYHYVATADPVVVADADMLHIALLGFDGVRGYPLVQLMRASIETNKVAERFTLDYLQKGTFLRGTLEFPQALTAEQEATLRRSIDAYRGATGSNRFSAMILQAGGKLNNSTVPNQTSQLIETRKFSDITVCQMLRVPPHIIYQMDGQKLANMQQAGAEVRTNSLSRWIGQIEDEFTAKLFTQAEQDAGLYARLHTDSLLQPDDQTLSTQMLAEVNGGLRTVNEARAELELDPLDDPTADQLRVPVNFPTVTTPNPPTEQSPDAPATTDQPDDGTKGNDLGGGVDGSFNASAVLTPLVTSAIERITTRTDKAFANHGTDDADKRTRWANVFSTETAGVVRETFAPIAEAAAHLGVTVNVDQLADRYAQGVRRRASTGEPADLSAIYQGQHDQH